MIIVLRPDATGEQKDHVIKKLKSLGLQAHVSEGTERTIIGAIGDEALLQSTSARSRRTCSWLPGTWG